MTIFALFKFLVSSCSLSTLIFRKFTIFKLNFVLFGLQFSTGLHANIYVRQREEPSTHNFRLISKYTILLKLNNVLHFKHHSNISNGLLLLLPFLLLKNRIQFINCVCCRQLKHLQQRIFFCKHIPMKKKQPKCLFEWMMLLLIYRIKLAHINPTKKINSLGLFTIKLSDFQIGKIHIIY